VSLGRNAAGEARDERFEAVSSERSRASKSAMVALHYLDHSQYCSLYVLMSTEPLREPNGSVRASGPARDTIDTPVKIQKCEYMAELDT
jgi:hypothetical protein